MNHDSAKSCPPPRQGLSAVELEVGYPGSPVPVLHGESLEIRKEKINILIGPNGSGKSTLLKTLARQLIPGKGQVLLDSQDLRTLTPLQMASRIGILFQENTIPGDINVEELVYFSRYPRHGLFDSLSEEDHNAVEKALAMTGTASMRKTPVRSLSSGQRQLAWIALLLAQTPDYLFLDEPTTFLDLEHQFEVLDCIRKLNHELHVTIVMIIHDLNLAAQYADWIFAMSEGHLVKSGSPQEVITPELLRKVFHIEADVVCTGGKVCCIPLSRLS